MVKCESCEQQEAVVRIEHPTHNLKAVMCRDCAQKRPFERYWHSKIVGVENEKGNTCTLLTRYRIRGSEYWNFIANETKRQGGDKR
jgi:hypothetical protein